MEKDSASDKFTTAVVICFAIGIVICIAMAIYWRESSVRCNVVFLFYSQ